MESDRIYLDWNATGVVEPRVREAMVDSLQQGTANASSVHREGQRARHRVEQARRKLAEALNAEPQAVILTGGATESNNQVLWDHVRTVENPYIVTTAAEHPSVLEVVERIQRAGYRADICPIDEVGQVDLDELETKVSQGATLISCMWANNETGTIYPVERIAELADEYGAVFHTDATQAFGRIPVDFDASGADLMTLSFHKSGGPKGIGAIVKREGLKIGPFMAGGHQERGRRPGTENVSAAAGLIALADAVRADLDSWTQHMEKLRRTFLEGLEAEASPYEFRGDQEHVLPNTVNVAFEGIDGENFLLAADLAGVAASSGSACTAGSLEPSHVITAMGYDYDSAKQSVRFSFGPSTSLEQIREAIERISGVLERLRGIRGDRQGSQKREAPQKQVGQHN